MSPTDEAHAAAGAHLQPHLDGEGQVVAHGQDQRRVAGGQAVGAVGRGEQGDLVEQALQRAAEVRRGLLGALGVVPPGHRGRAGGGGVVGRQGRGRVADDGAGEVVADADGGLDVGEHGGVEPGRVRGRGEAAGVGDRARRAARPGTAERTPGDLHRGGDHRRHVVGVGVQPAGAARPARCAAPAGPRRAGGRAASARRRSAARRRGAPPATAPASPASALSSASATRPVGAVGERGPGRGAARAEPDRRGAVGQRRPSRRRRARSPPSRSTPSVWPCRVPPAAHARSVRGVHAEDVAQDPGAGARLVDRRAALLGSSGAAPRPSRCPGRLRAATAASPAVVSASTSTSP